MLRLTFFLLLLAGMNPELHARITNFSPEKKSNSSYTDSSGQKFHFTFYTGASFVNYKNQKGLLELSFPYSMLDTTTGGQIAEVFSFSKNNLPGNSDFVLPIIGGDFSCRNFFIRGDFRVPHRRRINDEHLSFGYQWRTDFPKDNRTFSLLAGINATLPDWVSSVFVRGEMGFDFYKPNWELGEIPVDDTTLYVMGYTVKKSASDVRKLGVYYEENVVGFIPSLTFGIGTSQNKIDFSLTLSPLIPLREKGGVRLLYKKNNTGWLDPYTWFWFPYKDVVQPGQSGVVLKYNGNEISKTPYHFGGMEILLRIGFRIK